MCFSQASAAAASAISEDPTVSGASAAVPGAVADASAEAASVQNSNGSVEGDVYVADESAGPGVWEVDNVLDAEYDSRSEPTAYESRTLSLEVTNYSLCGFETVRMVKYDILHAESRGHYAGERSARSA